MSIQESILGATDAIRGASLGRPIFSLSTAGTPLRVVRFAGQEGLSSLFEFRIEVASEGEDLEALLGQPARFQIEGSEAPRLVHGIVSEAEYVGHTRSLDLYELTIMPWAHRLHHRSGMRIFQDKTTEQIIAEVLTKAGLPRSWFRFSLNETYAPRNYCVQYRETDLAFLSRLMEEDGIFYFFEHEANKHVWVMADHHRACTAIPGGPALRFQPPLGSLVQDRESVRQFRFGGRTRPGKVTLRDLNLHKPDENMEVSEASKLEAELEFYDFPGEYQSPGRSGPHEGQSLAKIRLEELRATRRSGHGESDCPRLVPGGVMELVGHPRAELNAAYRVMRVSHSGSQPQVLDQDASGESTYQNSFVCMESEQPYRPARVTPRPVVRGLQTATVVGPDDEEIHTDEHGRVRVQFHWDREGKHDENSTCWVRVSQLWAGNGWGALFLPRIGHEVLVDFLEGDPDRPIVTGRIYHGNHHAPYALPDHKTQSGIKTESSPGGGGSNELRFEDAKGREEVYLHAQRDLTEKVENVHSTSVGADQSNSVGGSQVNAVTGDQTESVGGKQTMTIDKNRKVTVAGSQSVQIKGVTPEDGVSGSKLDITGDYKIDASNTIEVQAPTHIRLTCGGSTITIEPHKITLSAGGKAQLVLDVAALLKSAENSHVKLDADALSKASSGAQVKLTADVLAQSKAGSKMKLDAEALMSSPKGASVQAPTATLAGAGGMVEAAAAGLSCAGTRVEVSGSVVNVAGSVVKIN
ncbi:type VI secretion system Vgr family protein [Nannocystis pusilla]|uniref:Type VI secretion system tip protein VgrG n=1 Tax=Nannocystis pusilla TaxID=889268 RepID=A0ABS7TMN1_9BACT|nr:type VI secretion system tip protein VgrG [Nannocystis pusilla]MBZ5709397.1 type VI secretion system tip protein VgrG [Nannocystis pusilla]